MSAFKLLISGGSTGGHLFPAIAAAQELRRRLPESEVLFLGAGRKIDTLGLTAHGFAGAAIKSFGFKGAGFSGKCKAMYTVPKSIGQAMIHIRRFRPNVVLGVGGYVTGPVLLAAKLAGIPIIIHEQNSVPGMANRLLGKVAAKICLSLPASQTYFPVKKCVLTGNPVRENILALAKERAMKVVRATSTDGADSIEERNGERKTITLLVLGGSQGATAINTLVADAFCDVAKEKLAAIRLIHQTGENDEETIKKRYAAAGVAATVAAFFTDMTAVYSQADFCLSRAGATTLAELAVVGLPALLVPYPHAADNHQTRNGDHYAQGGGAWMFKQDDLTGESLARHILALSGDPARLWAMERSMRGLAKPEAAKAIVDVCLQAAGQA